MALFCLIAALSPVSALPATLARAASPSEEPIFCNGAENLYAQPIRTGEPDKENSQPDLVVNGECHVRPSPNGYFYRHVNIIDQGQLIFDDNPADSSGNDSIDFWARAIIVEAGGKMLAGATTPFGANGGILTIHLYGKDQSSGNPIGNPGQGVLCVSQQNLAKDIGPCGIPWSKWTDNGQTLWGISGTAALPGGVRDYFYQYDPLYGDSLEQPDPSHDPTDPSTANSPGYFGYKTLGVSYDGTLILRGFKGATYNIGAAQLGATQSGTSWRRLQDGDDLAPNARSLTLDEDVSAQWRAGDMAVVTTTDFLPGHSELIKLDANPAGTSLSFHTCATPAGAGGPPADPTCPGAAGLAYTHIGTRYGGPKTQNPLSQRLIKSLQTSIDPNIVNNGVESRAAVALLSRSIRIVSAGDYPGDAFYGISDPNHPNYFFGGHTVFRQGFAAIDVQGVEFYQLGQGGKLGHYPVHFHMARHTPPGTIIADSSVWDSMTRWYVVHSTLGVTLERNVGYLSIGHGYYLEDGTETDNKFYSNIGIFARAAIANPQNPRNVPGILADNSIGVGIQGGVDAFPYVSDWNHPTVFWITNGWNDFSGNVAVGAATCGACYWLASAYNSNITDNPPVGMPGMKMTWWDYAGLQKNSSFAGTTPLKSFYDNSCAAAMNAFQTVGGTAQCHGVAAAAGIPQANDMVAVKSMAPNRQPDPSMETYYPLIPDAAGREATRCPATNAGPDGLPGYDCSKVQVCASGDATCAVTVLDHFTTLFNFAPYNFAAIWLRPKWFLVDNSVVGNVLGPGLTFVSGGDYTRSSAIEGYWVAARNSLFIGETQPQDTAHKYAAVTGPFAQANGNAPPPDGQCTYNGNECVNPNAGISIQIDNFGVAQRLFNIYDGPAFEDHNAYLDVKASACPAGSCIYYQTPGLRLNTNSAVNGAPGCFMPNAGIAWKQPNGFYYPPAFHSHDLQFDNVDLRHYVIEPLFNPTTYVTVPPAQVATQFCGGNTQFTFDGYTDIDRQTELNDDDGSLTGLTNNNPPPSPGNSPPVEPQDTISVNEDPFFQAPVQTGECLSNVGVDATGACPIKPPGTPQFSPPQTAETSPYDYVTTAVLPGCSQGPSPTCGMAGDGMGGVWSANCGGPYCYGVPLYRQFLTGSAIQPFTLEYQQWVQAQCNTAAPPNPAACRYPFIRMAGQRTYQRSTLTANHGTYYLDTTVPDLTQRTEAFNAVTIPGQPGYPCDPEPAACATRSLNVFQAKQTYYVYFVYAKATTKQTYQIYVGSGFNVATDIYGVRGNISSAPVQFGKGANPWTVQPTYSNGILTVQVDLSAFQADLDPTTKANGLCQPATFCAWTGTGTNKTCGCALQSGDPQLAGNANLKDECNNACAAWGAKDVDCPGDGCIGFAFRLPADFQTTAVSHRPQPTVFPVGTPGSGWQTLFQNTSKQPDSAKGSLCYYATLPGSASCKTD